MPTWVALLHSVVLTPQRRVVMNDLRAMAAGIGLTGIRSLASTGNLVFESEERDVARLEEHLEAAFAERFGKHVDIIVRSAPDWLETAAGNPFPERSERDGSMVGLRIMRRPLPPGIVDELQPYLTAGEQLALVAGDLWAAFSGRPSESRLLGALTTRRLGIGTSRNWNTVRGLKELLQ